MQKFDFIFTNPPYTNGLDLKLHQVFQKCLTDNGRLVSIQPSGFLLSHRETQRKSYEIDTSRIEYANLLWGNALFEIGLFVPVAITSWYNAKKDDGLNVIDEAYTGTEYHCSKNEVHLYGKDYPRLKEWLDDNVKCENGSIHSHFLKKSNDEYGILLSARGTPPRKDTVGMMNAFYFSVRGHPPRGDKQCRLQDDFFTVVPKDESKIVEHFVPIDTICKIHARCILCFHSDVERLNFIKYVKTKCVRFNSGPMSGLPHYNFEEFNKAEEYLSQHSWEIVNPVKICLKHKLKKVLSDPNEFNKMVQEELDELVKCNAIYMLRGWKDSVGANREFELAKKHGLLIIFQETV